MTRKVSQILWEYCMGELGYGGNDYENDTFAVRSYNWADEDANDWHFWHKPSGLKIEWYKYPLRGFEANMEITDDQFLDVLRDCTNSMEDGKEVRFLHDIRRWWTDRNSSEKPNNSQTCANCKFDHEEWFEEACDSCCDAHSNWQPKAEPQTDYRITGTIGYRCPKCGRGNFLKNESNCFYCGEPLIKTKSQTETHDIRTDTHECVKDTHDKLSPSDSEKPNNSLDKDTNVRSKEPQTERSEQ